MLYVDLMATYTGTSATFATATTGGSYSPQVDGRLRKLTLIAVATAATSLIEGYEALLKSSKWPADVTIGGTGAGIRTAPAFPIAPDHYEVDLPVRENSNITIEFRHHTGTVVTPVLHLYGTFEG